MRAHLFPIRIPRFFPAWLALLAWGLLCQTPQDPGAEFLQETEGDLLIHGGTVIDGSGGEAYRADILVRDGLIVGIGIPGLENVRAATRIDAEGKLVTPGFIDSHAHGDPLQTPRFLNFLSMGVTTLALGQDGRSPGTADVAGWMERVEREELLPNILHFTGHGTLRALSGAGAYRRPGPAAMSRMHEQLGAALCDGSFGMTTGLEYLPGSLAGPQELASLAATVAKHRGLIMSHLRSEDDDRIGEAVGELLRQGRESGAQVHVSHLKIVGSGETGRAEDVLNLMEKARKEGMAVTADLYPYTASYTGISILFPEWALPPAGYEAVAAGRRDELREYLRDRVLSRNGPDAVLFGTPPWAGRTLEEVAAGLGKPFEDVLIEDIGPRGASAAYFVMSEQVMRRFLQDPYVMVASDGNPSARHPRGYGTFARIIRQFVVEEELFTPEEAVRKMSGLPAQTLRLDDPEYVKVPRGLIREGFAADLLVFRPENVRDRAGWENPQLQAEGFDQVVVNGALVMENGRPTGRSSGIVIRRRTGCAR